MEKILEKQVNEIELETQITEENENEGSKPDNQKNKKRRTIAINSIVQVIVICLFIFFAIRGIDDLTGTYKIDKTIRNTKEIRVALEKYYQLTGTYPDLTKPGASMELHILDYVNEAGETISFAKIYGKEMLEKTYGNNGIIASNAVYDVQNFDESTNTGGWNYNYLQKTGEIHPNLPNDIYLEKINWTRQ